LYRNKGKRKDNERKENENYLSTINTTKQEIAAAANVLVFIFIIIMPTLYRKYFSVEKTKVNLKVKVFFGNKNDKNLSLYVE